jgi:hypothetical protein
MNWIKELLVDLEVIGRKGSREEREGMRSHVQLVRRTIDFQCERGHAELSPRSIPPPDESLGPIDP